MLVWKQSSLRASLFAAAALFVFGCGEERASGPVQIHLLQPTAGHCQYTVAPASVQTLTDITTLQGRVGRVVYNSADLESDESIVVDRTGFQSVSTQFSYSGGTYAPLDYTTLFAASLYYAIERGYLLFSALDPQRADVTRLVPDLAETYIIHEAHISSTSGAQSSDIMDNAQFYQITTTQGMIRNYFMSFPTDTVTEIPLGLNLGIMVHEFTHLVFQYMAALPLYSMNKNVDTETSKTQMARAIKALNEGLADYFGFLATQDPGYFLCSYPEENRDLAVAKPMSGNILAGIQTGAQYDPHEGGAVWASANYAIGQKIGSFEDVGKSLIVFMQQLPNCIQSAGESFSLAAAAQCHLSSLSGFSNGRASSAAQEVYSAMGLLGGAN